MTTGDMLRDWALKMRALLEATGGEEITITLLDGGFYAYRAGKGLTFVAGGVELELPEAALGGYLLDTRRGRRLRHVIPRLGVGAGLAAIPAAAAITGGAAAWSCLLVGLFIALIPVGLLVPLAPYLPVLHRLPGIGAVQLAASFEADGRNNLVVGIRRLEGVLDPSQEHASGLVPAFEQRIVHLEVCIRNPVRADIDHAAVAFTHPEGVPHLEADRNGQQNYAGEWAHDRWEWRGRLPGRSQLRFYFHLTFFTSGAYPVGVEVVAPDLFRPFRKQAVILVNEVERGKEPWVDRMAYVIQDGEDVHSRLDDDARWGMNQRAMMFHLAILEAIPDGRPELNAIVSTPVLHGGSRASAESLSARVLSRLARAYEVRRRLAKSEDQVP